jgi:hypothetical protein
LAPRFQNGVSGLLQRFPRAPAKHRLGSHGGDFRRNGSADAAPRAGNDGDLASQTGMIVRFRSVHGDPPVIFVMLNMHNHNSAKSHLNKLGRKADESALALLEVHTYNPAHRK